MPRRRSYRKFKRRLGRLMRRRHRRARSRSKYGRIRKIKKVRGVYGRKSVKGWKQRLNNRSELKYTTYLDPTASRTIPNFANGLLIIWSTNTVDLGGANTRFTWPQAGAGNNQVEGNKFNALYMELIFDIVPAWTPAQIAAGTAWDTLRIMFVRERDSSLAIPTTNNLFVAAGSPNFPINSKAWDINMDRTYQYTTGFTLNQEAGTLTNPNDLPPVGYNQDYTSITGGVTTIGPKAKRFRMIIPIRKTFNIQPLNTLNAFPYDMYLLAYTLNNQQYLAVNRLTCTFYYRDP